ncbi:choice-of-anchor D domain-containing protein [Terrimonas rubra]|uniref:Choice-of-anchor D domain-containing protein n=1 Tax=Terrimonas rubra TaxID=1035890 RepID=A0ABW6ABV1_9BACT
MRKNLLLLVLQVLTACFGVFAQTPVPMASQPSTTYTENFADIANWTFAAAANGTLSAGTGAAYWRGNPVNTTGAIPSATRITTTTAAAFASGTSGGVQKGTGNLQFLTTGGTANTSSLGFDLFLDFTGTTAGTISFDAATVFNSTGDRVGTLRLYATTDGTTWTELTGTNLPYVATNNVAGSGSITSIALPAAFSGSATAQLRFYYHNGDANGSSGSRPKISIDNLSITATLATAPVLTPTPATLDLGVTNINTTSSAQNFSLAGSNLTADVTLNTAAPFAISTTENGTYSTSLTIPPASFSSNQTVYVRFTPTAAQAYAGTISITSTGAGPKTVTLEGEGFDPSAPLVTVSTGGTIGFGEVGVGQNSASQSFTVTGANLTGNVTVTGTADFSVSLDNTNFSNSVTIPQTDAALTGAGRTIFVRFHPTATGLSTDTLIISTNGAQNEEVIVAGTGVGVINLTSSPYVQNFDGVGAGLPAGITARTSSTNTAIGTVAAFAATVTAANDWTNTGGGFKNYRSGVDDAPVTDRAFGVRQVSGTDPGAAFVFQIANTANKVNFTLDFLLQSLDASSPRTTTWAVQYGIGLNPTSFVTPASVTGNLTTGGSNFGVNPIHVDFGSALDDIAGVVTIRIAALTGSSGTGNRPSSAIDDFTLNWQSPTDKTISTSVSSLSFPATNVGANNTLNYTVNSTNLTSNLVITTTGAYTVSADNTTFTPSISLTPTNGTPQTVYVRFAPTATGVVSGTIVHTSTDAFTRNVTVSGEGVDPNQLSFNFNTCTVTSIPGSGFLSINSAGVQKWGCSQYGRNSTNGVDVNGFSGGAAQTNEAWLISPVLNLSGIVNMPVLSFYSRGEFSGPLLKLYVSTTYDGVSVPNVANWTEITNANFPTPPGAATTAWTLSDNIDLSAYKAASNVRIAFVYTSSSALGAARWSVDDIAITDQSSLLSVSPSVLSFGEVSVGNQSVGQAVNLQAVGGSSNYTVTAPAGYEVSLDNSTFTPSVVITQAVAASGTSFYVRFAPGTKSLKIEGNVTVTATGLNKPVVSVTGSSYPKAETLDIATYNLSFFGSNSNNNATPAEVTTQVNNITTVLNRLDVDVIGFQEMSNDAALTTLMSNLPGYASVTSPLWSYSFNPPDPTFPPQKIGFIYNTNTMTLSTTEPPRVMFEQIYNDARNGVPGQPITGYPTGTASSFWSSGRLPFIATFNTNINGANKKIRLVVLHAKSGSAIADYNRRVYDIRVLKDSLDAQYPNDEVMILGDFNDRLNGSIAAGQPSSYTPFLADAAQYSPLTLALDQAGRTSFPSSGGMIDHMIVSNELLPRYIATSADIEDPRSYVAPYNATTASDHLPVFARFDVLKVLPVTFTHVQAIQKQKLVAVEWITASETNNAYFIVERSANGADNFTGIGKVNGNGTTTTAHQYWFNDEAPLTGNNYYRIKQVDIDGKFSYSKVVTVKYEPAVTNKIVISPNPVRHAIRLQLDNNETVYDLKVYSVDGKLQLQNTGAAVQLNSQLNGQLNKLTNGLYFIQLRSKEKTFTASFVKE